MTIERAKEAYLRYQRAAWMHPDRTSEYSRDHHKYMATLEADRRCQRKFEDVTTAMLTRRLSPIEDGEWLTPWTLHERLHDDGLWRKRIYERLTYQLRNYNWEYVGITATTDSAATPHEHLYFWVNDPDDEIDVSYFEDALTEHVERCVGAYWEDHQYRRDGTDGAITVEHDPSLVDDIPDQIGSVYENSATVEDGSVPANTRGAQYLASQLDHLVLRDVYDGTKDVHADDIRVTGAAIKWATPEPWYKPSDIVPPTSKFGNAPSPDETGDDDYEGTEESQSNQPPTDA